MTNMFPCEYIWLDGSLPVRQIRSKNRIVFSKNDHLKLEDIPTWVFDGSSCGQATGHDSDLLLQPVNMVYNPLSERPGYLVMCEVYNPDNTPHISNSRIQLRQVLDAGGDKYEPWIGFEQEYTLFQNNRPLGWPEHGYPAPQGPYYCGVGSEQIFGRELAELHANICMDAGLLYYGMNAEVMPAQWEFQIGYRGNEEEDPGLLNVCDHLWLARWLIHRLSEEHNIHVSLDNKPVKGDWNGAGLHTNFSTNMTRDPETGLKEIEKYINRLEKKHAHHIKLYGDGLAERLTGQHETCNIHEFKAGAADRGSSIRIPRHVSNRGCGYLEDRRPGANADPYLVAARILATTCDIDETVMQFSSWPRQPLNVA